MRFTEREILKLDLDSSRARVADYFSAIGYSSMSALCIRFTRGSIFGTLTSFSPRKWRATADITYEFLSEKSTEVIIDIKVNTTGQRVTPRERNILLSEVNVMKEYLRGDSSGLVGIECDIENVSKSSIHGIVIFALVAFPCYFVFAFISSQFAPSIRFLASVFAILCGVYAARKHWGLS